MEAALPLESVDFDHSVEASGKQTALNSLRAMHFDFYVVILPGDVSSMSAEQYLSWVR